MKRILFITSQYRVGERIYPIIPHLSTTHSVDLLKVYQMSNSHKWVGDSDLRKSFDDTYLKYFDNVLTKVDNLDKYNLIISDDNRHTPKTNLSKIYNSKKCTMVCFSHGNTDKPYFRLGKGTVFDKCFVFGKKDIIDDSCISSGIPSNDHLVNYIDAPKKHILVIVNFLGNRHSPFKVNFDKKLFESLNLLELQQYFNLPTVIKLKSRADEGGYSNNIKYLNSILPNGLEYNIKVDVLDDNKLISESACVISAPSTLAFKPIQLNIPTIIIKESGQIGSFYDFDGLFCIDSMDTNYLKSKVNYSHWIELSIEGGLNFNSTVETVKKLNELL